MSTLAHLEKDFNDHIMGYSAIGIIISTCLGGIAVMEALTFGNGLVPMFFVLLAVSICAAHNAAILTVQKPTIIFRLLVASTVINSLIIVGALLLS
ncbi:hypothetical protein [Croceiramulus getboli]|nr:hypothetical protein P8624_10715 [Flavobacteriaceae bacterium YJPT1-3]